MRIKKNIIIIFLVMTMLNACGYTPIYYKENIDFKIKNIEMEGDKLINNRIYKNLKNIQSQQNNQKIIEINLYSIKEKKITTKNSKCDAKSLNLRINTKLTIKDNNSNIMIKNFGKSFNYNNIDRKFDLKKNEKKIQENLAEEISEEIILFLYSL